MTPPPAVAAPGVLQLQEMLQRVINISVGIAFIFLTATLVWAGIKFITSGGDSKTLSSTWSIVTWSLLGIVFLTLGWIILQLIESFTGVPVTKFSLCTFFPNGACPKP